MIRSIFTRDGHPGIYDPAVIEALVADGDEVRRHDPDRHLSRHGGKSACDRSDKGYGPVLMMRGEWDGNSTNDDLLDFFRQLPNGDRQFVILPHIAHSPGFSKNRAAAVVRDEEFPCCAGAGRELSANSAAPSQKTRAAPYRFPPALPRRDNVRTAAACAPRMSVA